jgi:hypothetical protein
MIAAGQFFTPEAPIEVISGYATVPVPTTSTDPAEYLEARVHQRAPNES